jgi:hypothetical protein
LADEPKESRAFGTTVVRKVSEINKDDEVGCGQPVWYYGLSKDGKQAELERRAEAAGTTYVRDGSYDGLKDDGGAPEKERAKRNVKQIRLTAKRREAIERRAKGETETD